jgi:hypothetical protein
MRYTFHSLVNLLGTLEPQRSLGRHFAHSPTHVPASFDCSRSPRRAAVTLSKWQPLPKQRCLRHKALPVSGPARRRGVDYRIPIVPVHNAWNAVLGPRQLLAYWRVCVLPWLGGR